MDRMAPRLPLSTATDFDKLRMSQIRQVLSWFPVANIWPSGCHADANEKSKCPCSGVMVYNCKGLTLHHLIGKNLIQNPQVEIEHALYLQALFSSFWFTFRFTFSVKGAEGGIEREGKKVTTFPLWESTNIPSGSSPTMIRSLPSGLREVCCSQKPQKISKYH